MPSVAKKANPWQISANVGRHERTDQIWQNPVTHRPNLVDVVLTSTNFGRRWSEVGRFWPESARNGRRLWAPRASVEQLLERRLAVVGQLGGWSGSSREHFGGARRVTFLQLSGKVILSAIIRPNRPIQNALIVITCWIAFELAWFLRNKKAFC